MIISPIPNKGIRVRKEGCKLSSVKKKRNNKTIKKENCTIFFCKNEVNLDENTINDKIVPSNNSNKRVGNK
jgi:hypothetical protein